MILRTLSGIRNFGSSPAPQLRARAHDRTRGLRASPGRRVYVQPVTQLEIASPTCARALRAGLDPKFLMPDSVRRIILTTECYAEN